MTSISTYEAENQPAPELTSIFVKACRSQLNWLCYCLQFLEKNWVEPKTEIVVMLDEDCKDVIQTWGPIKNVIYIYCQPWPDTYMHALWCKANADMFTRGDPIILLDCDTILTDKASLENYMEAALNEWEIDLYYLDWTQRGDDGVAQKLWTKVVKESTGFDLERDYMVSRPWIFWRSTYAGAREIVEKHRNLPFYAATYSTIPFDHLNYLDHPFTFCDLQNLGYYAAHFEPERYWVQDFKEVKDDIEPPVYKDRFKDYWSHTSWTAELVNHLDGLLTAPC
jgi:hypothetical protein